MIHPTSVFSFKIIQLSRYPCFKIQRFFFFFFDSREIHFSYLRPIIMLNPHIGLGFGCSEERMTYRARFLLFLLLDRININNQTKQINKWSSGRIRLGHRGRLIWRRSCNRCDLKSSGLVSVETERLWGGVGCSAWGRWCCETGVRVGGVGGVVSVTGSRGGTVGQCDW